MSSNRKDPFESAIEELASSFVRTKLYDNFKFIKEETGSWFGTIERGNVVYPVDFREKRVAIECMLGIDFFAGYAAEIESMWRQIAEKALVLCEKNSECS